MPKVTVSPIQSINVRVNQNSQKTVASTSQFVGAANVQAEVNDIKIMAQNAYNTANTATIIANDALPRTGGTITGSLEITNNLIVDQVITANNEIIDAGLF